MIGQNPSSPELISDNAVEFIVDQEVTSKGYYVNHYARPTWPEGASGVTIAIGYDVGYVTVDKLWADWRGKIPNAMIQALETAVGAHGEAAHQICSQIRNAVTVPWDVAMEVFLLRDIPEWTKKCQHDLPNFDKLPLDCKGALVSIAYNRGNSWNMPASEDAHGRFTEMRAIKAHMIAGNYQAIPDDIRSMKRLWNNGLVARREHEATMFEKGLAAAGT